ncbi:MAG: polysaccharide biosynthesis protein [Bacteroidetes bacterium]|nr:polysaccharide biosynthesis protein [Bacteroidota bacterium]
MSSVKKLARQTAIYGLSSIVGRLLNYLLVPLYTRVFDTGEYGVVTQLYSYIAFLNLLFVFGLDTAYFRYFHTEKGNPKVYSSGLLSILTSSVILGLTIVLFASPLSGMIGFEGGTGSQFYPIYIALFGGILAFDAITALPFAKLRQENRAKRFATLRLVNIGINIGLNLFFLILLPSMAKHGLPSWLDWMYDPSFGVGYVFVSNLLASFITLLLLIPEIFGVKFEFDSSLWKNMIVYAFPLMIAGLAGMINETFDRILIPILITDKADAMSQLGVYGACYKLSILMTLFNQTFRYAAEPFFFSHSTKENPQATYATIMNWFVLVCSFIFLGIMLYLNIVQYFIGEHFRSGLKVVPILLMANLCLGVYYNQSIWYKLTGKTVWGAWISVIGAAITLLFNFLLIPKMGYMGAAWTTLICYASMMVISYFLGKKHYPVPYELVPFFYFIGLAVGIWLLSDFIHAQLGLHGLVSGIVNGVFLFIYIGLAWVQFRKKNGYLRAS